AGGAASPRPRPSRSRRSRGQAERAQREGAAHAVADAEPATEPAHDEAQLPPGGAGGGCRLSRRAEAGRARGGDERVRLDCELAHEERAELVEGRAARGVDALVDEVVGELLPARGGHAPRVAG